MLKNDRWIRQMASKGMIHPFEPSLISEAVISFGTSSYGYDLRIADEFKIPSFPTNAVIDPKEISTLQFNQVKAQNILIPPHSFILARSLEYFKIPRNVIALCFGKSTYARCGILMNITPLEPEWEGFITIAIANLSPSPARIHALEGIAQVIFLEASEPCEISYADRKGKYQHQQNIQPATI
jgi:dCTP deaminase